MIRTWKSFTFAILRLVLVVVMMDAHIHWLVQGILMLRENYHS